MCKISRENLSTIHLIMIMIISNHDHDHDHQILVQFTPSYLSGSELSRARESADFTRRSITRVYTFTRRMG